MVGLGVVFGLVFPFCWDCGGGVLLLSCLSQLLSNGCGFWVGCSILLGLR